MKFHTICPALEETIRLIYLYQVADKGRAIRYNISSALPLHDEGMMTGAFLPCTLDPNLLLE